MAMNQQSIQAKNSVEKKKKKKKKEHTFSLESRSLLKFPTSWNTYPE
jgi:hypothetical protein